MPLDYLNPIPQSLILPNYLVAGDTWVFTLARGPYTNGETATMFFGAGPVTFSQTAAADQTNFTFTFPSTQTEISPGPYRYSISVTDPSGKRTTLQTGAISVIGDPASDTWVKTESFLKTAIRKIESLILELLENKTSMVSFGGKQYYFQDLDKLWNLWKEYVAYAAQQDALLLGNQASNVILPLFVNR